MFSRTFFLQNQTAIQHPDPDPYWYFGSSKSKCGSFAERRNRMRLRSPVNFGLFFAQKQYPKLFQARLCLNILSFLNQEFYFSKLCRQEAWLEGGQEAMDKIEPFIRDQRLDAIFVDDYQSSFQELALAMVLQFGDAIFIDLSVEMKKRHKSTPFSLQCSEQHNMDASRISGAFKNIAVIVCRLNYRSLSFFQ